MRIRCYIGPAYVLKLNIKGVPKIPKRFNDVLIYQRKFFDYVLGPRNDICVDFRHFPLDWWQHNSLNKIICRVINNFIGLHTGKIFAPRGGWRSLCWPCTLYRCTACSSYVSLPFSTGLRQTCRLHNWFN